MANSVLEQFSDHCNDFVRRLILPTISEFIEEETGKKIDIAKLESRLKLAPPRTPTYTTSQSSPFGGGVTPTVSSSRSSGTTAANTTAPITNPPPQGQCKYVFRRGKSKGLFCGKTVVQGTEFCKTCSGRSSVKNSTAPPPQVNPQVSETTQTPAETKRKLKCKIYDKEKGLYIELNYNILFKRTADSQNLALGKLVDDNIVPLTDEEKEIARSLKFVFQEEKAEEPEINVVKENRFVSQDVDDSDDIPGLPDLSELGI